MLQQLVAGFGTLTCHGSLGRVGSGRVTAAEASRHCRWCHLSLFLRRVGNGTSCFELPLDLLIAADTYVITIDTRFMF